MSCQLRRLCKRNLHLLDLGSRLFRVYIFPIDTRGDTCEILSDVGGKPELLWVFLLYLFANGTKHCRNSRDFTLFDKGRPLRLCLCGEKRLTYTSIDQKTSHLFRTAMLTQPHFLRRQLV